MGYTYSRFTPHPQRRADRPHPNTNKNKKRYCDKSHPKPRKRDSTPKSGSEKGSQQPPFGTMYLPGGGGGKVEILMKQKIPNQLYWLFVKKIALKKIIQKNNIV